MTVFLQLPIPLKNITCYLLHKFLHQWVNDELFYVDFVDFSPFNRELASHFYVQRFISPMHKNWASKSFALFCADRLFKSFALFCADHLFMSCFIFCPGKYMLYYVCFYETSKGMDKCKMFLISVLCEDLHLS